MSIDVLQDHLLLLERLEAVHPDIAGGCIKHTIDRRGQVSATAFPLALCL